MTPTPFNQVRISPDGAAIAWHRPEVEDDDATPWLVVEQDPMYGVDHTWYPDSRVANWSVLTPPGDHAADHHPGDSSMTLEHKTRKGALLADLEHQCIKAGHWLVEGHEVIRHDDLGWWRVNGKAGAKALGMFNTFTEALEAIRAADVHDQEAGH